jgi:hypothetical protein
MSDDVEITKRLEDDVAKRLQDEIPVIIDSEIDQETEDQSIQDEPIIKAKPKFFIKPERRRKIEVEILSDPKTGDILMIAPKSEALKAMKLERLGEFIHTSHWFEFSIPDYQQMTEYRERCSIVREENEKIFVDPIRLRQFIIIRHLKDWSLTDENGDLCPLIRNVDGSLTSESQDIIYSLPSILVDVVMTAYERDVLLS